MSVRLAPTASAIACTVLVASAQNQAWIHQLGTSSYDAASCVSADSHNGVFVAGRTDGSLSGGSGTVWVARYSSDGSQTWARQFGSNSSETVEALVSNVPGGAYLCGGTYGDMASANAGGLDAWLARLDASGNLIWVRQLGTTAWDRALGVALDGVGGVFVTGESDSGLGGPSSGSADAWLARYDMAGNQLWIRQVGSAAADVAFRATSDGVGGVYIGGFTLGNFGASSAGGHDAWLARFNNAGVLQWKTQLGTPQADFLTVACTPQINEVIVGGYTSGSLGAPNAGNEDIWIAAYNSSGTLSWVKQLGSQQSERPMGMDALADSSMVVCGSTNGDLGGPNQGWEDIWHGRFDLKGSTLWLQQFGTTSFEHAAAVSVDSSGSVFLCGGTSGNLAAPPSGATDIWLAKFDSSCNPGEPYCIASTTSISGCTASLTATGSPTLSDPSAWTVSSGPVPGGNLGLLLFGSSGPDNTPYGTLGGMLCVAAPTFRTAPKLSGGDTGQCNGGYAFTLADLIAAAPIVTSGATINTQVWARDPANQDGFLLTDGVEVTVCP